MRVEYDFGRIIKKYIGKNEKVLLAVSGGVDSVVLTHLCSIHDVQFDIAHCNYQLRGEDSELDESFVKSLATKYAAAFFLKKIDLKNSSPTKNIQLSARNFRYDFFNELYLTGKYKFILTAHHKDDKIETFLINMLRGSGLDGLTALKEKSGNLLRPLLSFEKNELLDYAIKKGLDWREDVSNKKDDYVRNKIRHQVMPVFKEIQPNYKSRWIENIENLSLANDWIMQMGNSWEKENVIQYSDYQLIRNELLTLNNIYPLYLYLNKFQINISQIKDIIAKVNLESYKKRFWLSSDYKIIQEREGIQIQTLVDRKSDEVELEFSNKTFDFQYKRFKISTNPILGTNYSNNQFLIDPEKIIGKLLLRNRKDGDYFYLEGKSKKQKLKSYFINNKYSEKEKNETILLANGSEVIWILGKRKNKFYESLNTASSCLIEFV